MQLSSLIGHTQELFGLIVNSSKPADSLIDVYFRSHKYLGSHDRRFIAETTYGLLRHLRKCDFVLNAKLKTSGEELFEADRHLLLIAAYLFLKGKGNEIKSSHLCEKLKSSKLRDEIPELLVDLASPAVAAGDSSSASRIAVENSYPDWLVEMLIGQYGAEEAEKICSSLNDPAPITLRVNTIKANVEQCRNELNKQGIETSRTNLSPLGLNLTKRINVFSLKMFRDGWFEVQDEGSQLLPLIIDPKPNSKVLDVCAGAGGKTLELAALMKNRGEIFAADINSYRLEELRKRAKRAGAQNIRVQQINVIEDLALRFTGFFDVVLVDAPCSGIGTIRRNPGMKWTVTENTISEMSEKQKSILNSSSSLVKTGGKLVYATCTMMKQENEEVIEYFLSHHPDFIIDDLNEEKKLYNLNDAKTGPFLSLFPHINGTDGFFCAVFRKKVR